MKQMFLETTTFTSTLVQHLLSPDVMAATVTSSLSLADASSIELSSIASSAVHIGSPVEVSSSSFASTSSVSASSSSLGILTSSDGTIPVFDDQSNLRLPFYLRITATTICVILLLIGCPGNALVPYVVLKTKELRNSTNIFLINLSISDILVLIISTPTVLIELHSQPEVWFLGSFICEYLASAFSVLLWCIELRMLHKYCYYLHLWILCYCYYSSSSHYFYCRCISDANIDIAIFTLASEPFYCSLAIHETMNSLKRYTCHWFSSSSFFFFFFASSGLLTPLTHFILSYRARL